MHHGMWHMHVKTYAEALCYAFLSHWNTQSKQQSYPELGSHMWAQPHNLLWKSAQHDIARFDLYNLPGATYLWAHEHLTLQLKYTGAVDGRYAPSSH